MPKKQKPNPTEDKYWQEILDSVDMDFLPIEYVETIIVYFNDGRVWHIDVEKQKDGASTQDVESTLEQFFNEYDQQIANVDFRLDFKKLKADVSKRTRKFLKLNK